MRSVSLALVIALALLALACAPAAPADTPAPEPPSPSPVPLEPTPTPAPLTPAPVTPAPVTPSPAAATPEPAQPTPADTEASVSIFDLGYGPAMLEVSSGTTVSWSNDGQLPHTVTFSDGPDSGILESGANFEHSFDEAGTFEYICALHPTMSGTINVTD